MPAIRTKDIDYVSENDGDCAPRRFTGRRSRVIRPKKLGSFLTTSDNLNEDEDEGTQQTLSGNISGRLSPCRSSTQFSEASGTSDDGKSDIPHGLPLSEPIIISGVKLRPTVAFDTFWRFAAERKAIDDRRRAGEPAPWTDDKILQNYFFCNTFRVLDKGCQYLIKEVIEKGSQEPDEVVFRTILFSLYTKIETWQLLDRRLGPLTWATYNREKYRKVLSDAADRGVKLYTGAYIKPAPHFGYDQNYMNHLCLLEVFMEAKLASRLLIAPFMANVYEYLISFPSLGPFSTYQLMLSLSYTQVLNFHDNDFVISGPGSISGMNKLFGKSMQRGRNQVQAFEIEVMRYLAESQDYHFKRLGLNFSGLGPKRLPMSIADIEHTLCEVDKYSRVAHPHLKGKRTNIHRNFRAPTRCIPAKAVLPEAWSIAARRTPRIRQDKRLLIEKRYEVDRLDNHRDTPNGTQYHVIWVGYPLSEATWEPESSLLLDAPTTVHEYNAKAGRTICASS